MQRMKVLIMATFISCSFLLRIAGVEAQGLGEVQLLYEILSKTDQPAIKEMIIDAYDALYKKYGGGQESVDRLRMAQIKASGFSEIGEIKELEPKVDEALSVTYVSLDALKNYNENDLPEKIIVREKAFVVSIDISEKVRKDLSLVHPFTVVVPSKGETEGKASWKISQSGPSRNFQSLFDGRKEIIEKDYKSADSTCKCFLIWIPSLKQYLLGDQTSGEFKIKMLRDGLGDLKKGQLVAASKVFGELAREARTNKYDWPNFNPQKPQRP